jgi:two-component system, OmpR family, response regulator ChvI
MWRAIPAPEKTSAWHSLLVIHALASRPGVTKSRNELVAVTYRNTLGVDERLIDTHIKRLRKKFMASDSEFEMIESIYSVGHRFKGA